MITVSIEYPGGLDWNKDRRIEKAMGKNHGGAGFCFGSGMRDHSAYFQKMDAAKRCLKRVKALRIRGATVELIEEDAEE